MALITIENLARTKGPLLGIDPGSKSLGLAKSDDSRLIASPLATIKRKKFSHDAGKIFAFFDEYDCAAIIVGLPLNMDGSHGPRAQSANDFCKNLLALRNIPIMLWDERMSTIAAARPMLEADMSRAKRAENIDKLAAAYILQGVLDRLKTLQH